MPKRKERNWAMYIHFAQLLNILVPFLGLITVIILWQIKKEESTYINIHGKIVLNWMLSYFIYGIIAFFLIYVGIGIVILVILKIAIFILAIIAGLKANNGEIWRYPLSIEFLK